MNLYPYKLSKIILLRNCLIISEIISIFVNESSLYKVMAHMADLEELFPETDIGLL